MCKSLGRRSIVARWHASPRAEFLQILSTRFRAPNTHSSKVPRWDDPDQPIDLWGISIGDAVCSGRFASALQFESDQEPSELLVGRPLYLQVVDYLLLRQPKPSGFFLGNPVGFQLGWPVIVGVPFVP